MKTLLLTLLMFSVLSCTKAPDCHDEAVKKVVLELAPQLLEQKLEAAIVALNPAFPVLFPAEARQLKAEIKKGIKDLDLSLRATRITAYNRDTDTYTCAAELVIRNKTGQGKADILNVVYTSQLADSGKNFYVTLDLSEGEDEKILGEVLKGISKGINY